MSAAATFPPLLAAAQRRGSLMRALRSEVPAPSDDAPPLFWSLHGGMASLIAQLESALAARGVVIVRNSPAEGLERRGDGWCVLSGDESRQCDGVVLALPADVAGRLLQPHDDEAAGLLGAIDYASVTVVTLRVGVDDLAAPLPGTGFLVPRRGSRPGGKEPWAVTACTYLSQKWPHVAGEGEVLLRASLGRLGDERAQAWTDDEVVARVCDELGALMGLSGTPAGAMVTRWPHAFPQYRVHHLMRTAGVEAAVSRLGGMAVAGAAYRGVGIPACIASGRAAALALS
jgi:oxygen-dependent protoporphyrinogen oxidase